MNDTTKQLFLTEAGGRVFNDALRAVSDHSMNEKFNSGVVIGLSGGADSVMLLYFLLEYRKKHGEFPILAVHVNHMIRGAEADADEEFSKNLCSMLGVRILCQHIDIPRLAKESGLGIEEAARKARYSLFESVMTEYGYGCLAVAHNATDNLETVIHNMMRGAGTHGAAGILPVRDYVVRPLIYSPKSDIIEALSACGTEYCTDSTNISTEYTRNYIRHEILPLLSRLTPSPERMATRLSSNLREDSEYILSVANDFYAKNSRDGVFSISSLSKLSKPVFSRVLSKMAEEYSEKSKQTHRPERVHVDAVYSLLSGKDFSYSLPGDMRFVSLSGKCYIEADVQEEEKKIYKKLSHGINIIDGYSTVLLLCRADEIKSYSNIYKIETSAKISSDIIIEDLLVRSKCDGDSYVRGGMTRRLKKLYNDKKIPASMRALVPVVCDAKGILWVPGFGLRDGAEGKDFIIAVAEPTDSQAKTDTLYYSF